MSGPVFGWPIWSDGRPSQAATLAAGSWSTDLPLVNVQDRRLAKIARSTDAAHASTTIYVDLGVARSIGLFAVLIPNLTRSSVPTFNFGCGTSLGSGNVYDSGALQAWPTDVGADDVIGPDGSSMRLWQVVIPPAPVSARYAFLVITDEANADGYLDVARFIVAGAYRPSGDLQVGAESRIEDLSTRAESDAGAYLYRPKAQRRVDVFTLSVLPESETLPTIRMMQRQLGTTGQVFFVWDEDDPYRYERSYLATMRQLGPLQYRDLGIYSTVAFELAEDI